MASPPHTSKRFDGIQTLRAISVLLVIWTHFKYTGDFGQIKIIANSIGAVGVDIFFVISGFVICLSAKAMKGNGKAFFKARFTRIAPIYWLTSLPLLVMAAIKGKWDWAAVTSTFTFIPFLDFVKFTEPVNGFAWTLAYEFWFYSAVSIAMFLFGEKIWRGLFLLLTAGMFSVALFYNSDYLLPRFLFSPLLLEFFMGVLIFNYKHLLGKKSLVICTAGSIFFIIQLCFQPDLGDWGRSLEGGLRRVYFLGGVGAFLVSSVVAAERAGFTRWPTWTLAMGEASYSIYILQAYALWLAINAGRKFDLSPWLSGFIFVASNLAIGFLCTLYLEKPLTRWVRSKWEPRRAIGVTADYVSERPAA